MLLELSFEQAMKNRERNKKKHILFILIPPTKIHKFLWTHPLHILLLLIYVIRDNEEIRTAFLQKVVRYVI